MNKKRTKSKDFDDITLAYGLVKRMNGFHFCYTGNQELVRLGFMMSNQPGVKPYVTVKGKKFLMDVLQPLAENIPEDKPKEDENKKKVQGLLTKLKERPSKPARDYFDPDPEEEEDDEEEEELENDSQA